MADIEYTSNIEKVTPEIMRRLDTVLRTQSILLASDVKKEHMSGPTTPKSVSVRTNLLRSSTLAMSPKISETSIDAGISIGPAVYARVHVGPRGQVTTIRPKKGKFLAIPLEAAKTKAGVAKGSPRGGPWGETFFRRTKEGKLILFGKSAITKGARLGELRSKIIPLFLLVKQVRIPSRIHPEEITAKFAPKFVAALSKIGINIVSTTGGSA